MTINARNMPAWSFAISGGRDGCPVCNKMVSLLSRPPPWSPREGMLVFSFKFKPSISNYFKSRWRQRSRYFCHCSKSSLSSLRGTDISPAQRSPVLSCWAYGGIILLSSLEFRGGCVTVPDQRAVALEHCMSGRSPHPAVLCHDTRGDSHWDGAPISQGPLWGQSPCQCAWIRPKSKTCIFVVVVVTEA